MPRRIRFGLGNAGCATLVKVERTRPTGVEYAGEALVEGRRYKLNGWVRERGGKQVLWVAFLPSVKIQEQTS